LSAGLVTHGGVTFDGQLAPDVSDADAGTAALVDYARFTPSGSIQRDTPIAALSELSTTRTLHASRLCCTRVSTTPESLPTVFCYAHDGLGAFFKEANKFTGCRHSYAPEYHFCTKILF